MRQRQRIKQKIKFRKRTPFDESFIAGFAAALFVERFLPENLKLPALNLINREMMMMKKMSVEQLEEKKVKLKNITDDGTKRTYPD